MFVDDGCWPPSRIIDVLVDLIVSMQPPQMTTLQYSEVIKSKIARRSTKPSNEQEQLEFARHIAQVVAGSTTSSRQNVAPANPVPAPETHIATLPDLMPSEKPNLAVVKDMDAKADVIMTDVTPREDRIVPKLEGDINAKPASRPEEKHGSKACSNPESDLGPGAVDILPSDLSRAKSIIVSCPFCAALIILGPQWSSSQRKDIFRYKSPARPRESQKGFGNQIRRAR